MQAVGFVVIKVYDALNCIGQLFRSPSELFHHLKTVFFGCDETVNKNVGHYLGADGIGLRGHHSVEVAAAGHTKVIFLGNFNELVGLLLVSTVVPYLNAVKSETRKLGRRPRVSES